MRILFVVLSFMMFSECLNAETSAVPLPRYGQISSFQLTEAGGKAIGFEQLSGKPWIANFIFTRCAGPCPLISSQMAALTKQFQPEDGIHFVSFSVDPSYDSPKVLAEYAKKYSQDPRWLFLTGEQQTMFKLTEYDFHLGVEEIPIQERENAGQAIRHSTKFVLIDGEGQIRGYYDSESESSLKQLVEDAKKLII